MAARAILTCRPNSHPFQERNVSLEQPVKIGRSVARARPNGSNAIFDCKVLSRNHALLWHENGKFFLQDTKSSNGTFVNNQRLSKSSEESTPREVCSGDIVQFGVDVMEVNKKLTHGCIVANLQLFLPDGKEAKASSSTILPDKAPSTSLQEIYQLNQYIRDAMQREQLIETKLSAISKLVVATKESMADSWKTLIEEDRLLTRIDIMERQMQTSHKAMTDDKLKEEVNQLYKDKEKYQIVAKDALKKSMQEKMDVMKKHQDLERTITNWEEEKILLKEICEKTEEEVKQLAEKYEKSEIKSKELSEEIDTSSTKYKEEVEDLNKKLKDGEELLIEKQKVIDALIVKMDVQVARSILSAHNDDTKIILPENDINKLLENECIDGDKATKNNSSENINNKIELLEESKEKNKILQIENTAAKRQNENLQEKFNNCAIDLERYKRQVDEISDENSELKSQLSYLQDQMTRSDQNEVENCVKLKSQAEIIEANDRLIETLKEEVSALKSLINERNDNYAQISFKMNDLNVVEPEPEVLEVACQTVKELLSANTDLIEESRLSENNDLIEESLDYPSLKEKLQQTEEELAVFKDKFNECSAECLNLNRKVADLQSDRDTISDQSKLVQLRFILPIVIIVLAILIAFHPSS